MLELHDTTHETHVENNTCCAAGICSWCRFGKALRFVVLRCCLTGVTVTECAVAQFWRWSAYLTFDCVEYKRESEFEIGVMK